MIIAIITIDIERLMKQATAKIRLANSRSGMIGSGASLSR